MNIVRSKISSPFQLEKPVNPINFAGRETIIKNINDKIANLLIGFPQQILLCGQRGMGKTSLIHYLRHTYSKKKLLVIEVENPVSTSDFIIQTIEQILKKSIKEPNFRRIQDYFDNQIIISEDEKEIYDVKDNKVIKRCDIKFQPSYEDIQYFKANFHIVLKDIIDLFRLNKGLIIAVDEIDFLTKDNDFIKWYGEFGKNIKDTKDLNLAIFLTLKPDNLRDLYLFNPQFKSIFDVFGLNQLSYIEVESFYKNIFQRLKIKFDMVAISSMAKASKGLPFLMEEIGDAVFWRCDGLLITEQDVNNGIIDAGKITFPYKLEEKVPQYSK